MLKKIKKHGISPIITIAILTIIVGMAFYQIVENFTFVDSFYFCVITLTTIGYGDIVPTTDLGKIFTSIYAIFGIGIIAALANYLLHRAVEIRLRRHPQKETTNKINNH